MHNTHARLRHTSHQFAANLIKDGIIANEIGRELIGTNWVLLGSEEPSSSFQQCLRVQTLTDLKDLDKFGKND
ncbi:hypothetical protein J6590_053511 [Homalodisca vitripennis]|nr:hypothetical protein J6590_053511 [Homalodisca vitripennis]